MRYLAAAVAIAMSALLAVPARAQDDKQELKKKILDEIRKKLDTEIERIMEDISKLIDEEIAKARGRKKPPADLPVPPPGAPGKPGFLGVQPDPEQPETEDFEAWKIEGGVRILVLEDTPADKAGLRDGDVLFEADGKRVREWPDLQDAMRARRPGDKVSLKVMRGKESKELAVTLGVRPEMPDEEPRDERPAPDPKPEGRPGRLGISPGSATGKGLAIDEISKDTPAEAAGLKAGDVLTHLDATAIWKESDLEAFMKKAKAGQKVEVTILRDGEEKKFSVVLAAR